MSRLLIAASGTGGHLFPALAVAEELPSSWQVTWLGVPGRMEAKLVPGRFELVEVQAGAIQARGLKKLYQLCRLIFSTFRVCRLIEEKRIQIVFTTGGYISAPAILAALWSRIPVVLHESNALPGRVTRLMGRFCNYVALGWPPAAKLIPGSKSVITGTPVRSSFFSSQRLPDWVPSGEGPLLVIVGGSQGALGLNLMVRAVIPSLLEKGCRIVHLTGSNDSDVKIIRHPKFVERIFSNDMAALLQNADLVISRAGAGALSELAICRTPAVLVPYPFAKDQHQDFNAVFAAQLGGAVIVHQHKPEQKTLEETVNRLLKNRLSQDGSEPNCLLNMRRGMEKLAVPDAQKRLLNLLEQVTLEVL